MFSYLRLPMAAIWLSLRSITSQKVCPSVEKRSSSFFGIACKSRRRSWGKSHCRVQTLSHTLACLHILSRTPQRPSAHHYHSLPHRPLLGFQHLTKIIRKFPLSPIRKLFEAKYFLPPLINLWTDFTYILSCTSCFSLCLIYKNGNNSFLCL